MPPQPALLKKINNRFRWQVLVKVIKEQDPDGSRFARIFRTAAEQVQRTIPGRTVRIDVDVDPQSVM